MSSIFGGKNASQTANAERAAANNIPIDVAGQSPAGLEPEFQQEKKANMGVGQKINQLRSTYGGGGGGSSPYSSGDFNPQQMSPGSAGAMGAGQSGAPAGGEPMATNYQELMNYLKSQGG